MHDSKESEREFEDIMVLQKLFEDRKARKRPATGDDLHAHSVSDDLAFFLKRAVLFLREVRESVVSGYVHLLASWALELSSSKCLASNRQVLILASDGEELLADTYTRHFALCLAECTAHTGLQAICACTREHLVDARDVPRVNSHTKVEGFLSGLRR